MSCTQQLILCVWGIVIHRLAVKECTDLLLCSQDGFHASMQYVMNVGKAWIDGMAPRMQRTVKHAADLELRIKLMLDTLDDNLMRRCGGRGMCGGCERCGGRIRVPSSPPLLLPALCVFIGCSQAMPQPCINHCNFHVYCPTL